MEAGVCTSSHIELILTSLYLPMNILLKSDNYSTMTAVMSDLSIQTAQDFHLFDCCFPHLNVS